MSLAFVVRAIAALLITLTIPISSQAADALVKPRIVTEPVQHDSDDPAIWINRQNPAQSLVIGTDKDADGALYVFDLQGRVVKDKVIRGLLRPNNVDIAYDVSVGGQKVDVAVVSERFAHRLRIYRLPDMVAIDGGGIPVFAGEQARDVMGISLYTRASDNALFAIVSRSDAMAPRQGYLHQYRLVDNGNGQLQGVFTRAFGEWSGLKEIEAIAVDDALGYVYYSDETYGVRQYHADPLAKDADEQVAEFGRTDFTQDHEGISVYSRTDGSGYLLVSNQQADQFNVYERQGTAAAPHQHTLLARLPLSTHESDGSDLTMTELPGFPGGLFVAMSTDRTFQFYAVDDLLKAGNLAK
jgi:3-phytase